MASAKTKRDESAAAPGLGEVVAELRAIRAALVVAGAAVLRRDSAATYIGVSTATLDRLTSAGKLRSVRISDGRVGWSRKALDSYIAAQEAAQ